MIQGIVVSFTTVTIVFALGLGALELRRHQILGLTRNGFRWQQSDSWRRRGWMNVAVGVMIGFEVAAITAHSQFVSLAGVGVATVGFGVFTFQSP